MSHFQGLVQLAPCPKCGKKIGWFEKLICKYDQHYGPGGESEGTTDFVRVRGGERRFCMGCSFDITSLVGVGNGG